jgi:hypothetical protein
MPTDTQTTTMAQDTIVTVKSTANVAGRKTAAATTTRGSIITTKGERFEHTI